MRRYCVILPIRTGEAKELLGNRVFNCLDNSINKTKIFDDMNENIIKVINRDDVVFVKHNDIIFKKDHSMWLE